MRPLYVITTVFNPRRFESRRRLYAAFARWMTCCGVQLLTVEVSFGERPHAVTEAANPWHLQLYTRHELWHKERALNIGLAQLARLAPDWQYVAWMDADIKLARDDWAEEAVHLLQHHAVIQLFGECRSLGPDHMALEHCARMVSLIREFEHCKGRLCVPCAGSQDAIVSGHPGLAWAFRRDELEAVGGWLDCCANGSGDTHMANCYMGEPCRALPRNVTPGFRAVIERYGERCARYVRKNVSYLSTACDHYWHGRSKERGYEERHRLLVEYQFDPATDLLSDYQGLYMWNLSDPRVHALAVETRRSLAARNEDANEA